MTHHDLEVFYATLAETVDTVGADKSELMLAKLALLFAREIGDLQKAEQLVREAAQNVA